MVKSKFLAYGRAILDGARVGKGWAAIGRVSCDGASCASVDGFAWHGLSWHGHGVSWTGVA